MGSGPGTIARWLRAAIRAAVPLLVASPVAAQAEAEAGRLGSWWAAVDTGYSLVHADGGPGARADDGWVLAFRGGRVLAERWRLGLELGGVTFRAADLWDPAEGRALSDVLLVAEYHPSPDGGWYLHGGAGWIGYHDNDPAGGAFEGDGWGGRIGAGHEWHLGRSGSVGLLACWEGGSIEADSGDGWSYDALRLSVGWSPR